MANWNGFTRLASIASKKLVQGTVEAPAISRATTFSHKWRPVRLISTSQHGSRHERVHAGQHNVIFAASAVAAVCIYTTFTPRQVQAEAPPEVPTRLIRLAELHEHNQNSDTYWVFRGDRVYDITEWIPNHPGGEVILRAVGGSIEPYWNIFTIHQKQEVYDILEQYFVGKIDPRDLVDGHAPAGHVDDPFKSDPVRDESLVVRSSQPCNAETPKEALGSFLTSNDTFYVRNHLWVPDLRKEEDAEQFRLTVEMIDGEETAYSLADLRSKFKPHTITATLQCSGNRRSHMTAGSRQTNGLQWDVGAISTAEWTGVRLRDVLKDAGLAVDDLPEDVKHAQFVGAEAYGASIPVEKAIDQRGDVLLVYEMNGAPLPRDHGFPLRVLVPGHVAARSVKWLHRISMSDEESHSQWQRRDYKCFGPNEGKNPNWDRAVSIQEMPVQSAMTSLTDMPRDRLANTKLAQVYGLEEDSVAIEGYAYSGGGRKIVRVDVSPDNGKTWQQAQILEQEKQKGSKAWSWAQWRIAFEKHEVETAFLVKAVDESYNTQPDSFAPHYNFKGNLATGWHRVPVSEVKSEGGSDKA